MLRTNRSSRGAKRRCKCTSPSGLETCESSVMRLWRSAQTIPQTVGDELLLLEQDGGKLHRLNATAAWIYERCDGRSAADLAAEMASHFAVDTGTAQRDVRALAGQLVELGLVRVDSIQD